MMMKMMMMMMMVAIMAKVTYRGVVYDTDAYRKQILAEADKQRNHDLMYRGIKCKSKAKPCS